MDLKVIEYQEKKNRLTFSLSGVDTAYANTIRRLMGFEVPVMAIDELEIRKNSSILYDEVLAHRLGLVPLSTDLKSYNMMSECKCGGTGCASCTVKLTLKASGPGMVYASEIKSKDPAVKPLFGKMPIVKLLDGQEVELEATACLGQGKEHSKFCPGLIFYKIPSQEKDEFIFTVESWGQLDPKEIMLKAVELYDQQLEAFVEKVKKIE